MRVRPRTLMMVLAFVAITGLMVGLVGITFGRVRLEPANTYEANFTDASGLVSSSEVRVAGVGVGSVKSVDLVDGGGVTVKFTVEKDVRLTTATQLRIRYSNLVGDRYLELTPGDPAGAETLSGGASIPVARTRPALELDSFLRGFDPLLEALSPEQVNEFASNILAVTQGESGAVAKMLDNVGSFTNGLASRDELIGEVIVNLSDALGTIGDQRHSLDQLIAESAHLLKGLASDREQIVDSLDSVSVMANDISGLLSRTRPALKANLDQIGATSKNLNARTNYLEWALTTAPVQVNKTGRLGSYGGFFNFYLCSLQVEVVLPGTSSGILSPKFNSNEARCHTPAPQVPKDE